MKRKTREEKAITLIALIITIVVLLILAVVAINAVTGDGIIQHATNAKTSYEKAQDEEQDLLSYYGDYLATKGNAGTWKQKENYIINNDGIKIPIGAEVTYIPKEGNSYTSKAEVTGTDFDQVFTVNNEDTSWKVMGIEYGKIKLVSSNVKVRSDNATDYKNYVFTGLNNLQSKGVEELNNICSIYVDGNVAESARSINRDDIFKLSGVTQEEIKSSGTNEYFEYGVRYTYIYDEEQGEQGSVMYKKNNNESYISMNRQEIIFPDGTRINSENKGPKEVVSSAIGVIDFSEDSKKNSNMILLDQSYFIASESMCIYDKTYGKYLLGDFQYGIDFLEGSTSYIKMFCIYDSKNGGRTVTDTQPPYVRPVVVLKANAKLVTNGTDASGNIKYKVVQ